MLLSGALQVLTYRACHEQYDHHSRSDPERAVEVRVAFEHVEEVLAREEGAAASVQDLVGVDVEELLVEAYAPEVAFGA